jgi:hypothetical protein
MFTYANNEITCYEAPVGYSENRTSLNMHITNLRTSGGGGILNWRCNTVYIKQYCYLQGYYETFVAKGGQRNTN